MAQKRIWLYGDSFTEGEGTRILHPEYPEYYHAYKHYHFGTFLRNHWYSTYALVNKGVSGASDQWILNTALADSMLWEKDDIVIIGNSIYPRISFPVSVTPNKEDRHHFQQHKYVHFGSFILDKDNYNEICEGVGYDPKVVYGIREYFINSVVTNIEEWKQHASRINQNIANLGNIVRLKGVRVVVWDHIMWSLLETLTIWSNQEIDDLHWSPNGNIAFAHLLHDCLENNIYDLTCDWAGDYYNNWKKNGAYKKVCGGENEYDFEKGHIIVDPQLYYESDYHPETGNSYIEYDDSIPYSRKFKFKPTEEEKEFLGNNNPEDESNSLI